MKDKIINILLLSLLFVLILSLFSNSDNNNFVAKSQNLEVNISNSFTLPAWVKFNIINNTLEDRVINTCEDIKITRWTQNIILDECVDVTISSGWEYLVDMSRNYDDFFQTGQYLLHLEDWIYSFDIKNKWFFNKFFSYFFYAPVYNLMAFLLLITWYSLWWAIILITIIIRILLLVPQHKMMVSQRRLQQIQPKIKEIQDKYKWNHQMLGMELMKLYKEEKVNPMWSCGLLLIQMPILIVIFHIIISIQDYQNMYYLYWVMPDFQVSMISQFFYGLDLLWIWWLNGLLLAILVWLIQFIQVKLSLSYNKSNTTTTPKVLEKKKWSNDYSSMMPDPELINKFMLYWLPIMIVIFTFSFYAWVWVYWAIWTLFMAIQQLVVNKILKK